MHIYSNKNEKLRSPIFRNACARLSLNSFLSVFTLVLVLMGTPSYAVTIFDQSFTGADLFNHAGTQFGRDTALNGTSLVFGPSCCNLGLLLQLPVLQVGQLDPTQEITITTSYQFTRLQAATDLSFGITDQSGRHLLFEVIDDRFENKLRAFEFNRPNFVVSDFSAIGVGGVGGMQPIGQSAIVNGTFTISPLGTSLLASSGFAGTGSKVFSNTLNFANPIWVEFLGSISNENFQIDSLSVQVSGSPLPVPEPSTMILLGSGLTGLVGLDCRRKKYTV